MFCLNEKYIFSNCSRKCIFVQNSVTFLFIIQFGRYWHSSRCQFPPKIHWKSFQVDRMCTAVFKQHRVLKPYKAKCAKTVIAYEMKTVHDKDFIEAILLCKSAFRLRRRSINWWKSKDITKQHNTKFVGNDQFTHKSELRKSLSCTVFIL